MAEQHPDGATPASPLGSQNGPGADIRIGNHQHSVPCAGTSANSETLTLAIILERLSRQQQENLEINNEFLVSVLAKVAGPSQSQRPRLADVYILPSIPTVVCQFETGAST